MNNTHALVAVVIAAGLLCPAYAQSPAERIVGNWYTENNESIVEIFKYTDDRDGVTRYYGRITWLKEPRYAEDDAEGGKARHDRNNPEEARQNDPILGLVILKAFVYNPGEGTWDEGTLYDPKVGKAYSGTISLVSDPEAEQGHRLELRGYIGIPALGRTTVWTRVPENANSAARVP